MSLQKFKTKQCPSCQDDFDISDFAKCEYCENLIECDTCLESHYEDNHVYLNPITQEQFDGLEDPEVPLN